MNEYNKKKNIWITHLIYLKCYKNVKDILPKNYIKHNIYRKIKNVFLLRYEMSLSHNYPNIVTSRV